MVYIISNMQRADLNYKSHEGPSLRNLVDLGICAVYTLHPAMEITHFFVLTSSMYPLTIKRIHVIIKAKIMRCIMCFTNIVRENVSCNIHKSHREDTYRSTYNQIRLHEKIPRIPTSSSYNYV